MDARKTGMSVKDLRQLADSLFAKKTPLISLWQEIAENFYSERADFTVKRYLGDDYAGNLMTSYPLLVRRDLSDQIGTMLRNRNKPWFNIVAKDTRLGQDYEVKAWLEWATGTMRRVMYAPETLFTKATSQGDADFSTFGQTCITVRLNRNNDDLIYRCWHLRDVAWIEDEDGKICAIFRRWKPSLHTLMRMFDKPGASLHPKVRELVVKTPNDECECYHFMVAAEMFDGPDKGMPWRSIYYDVDHTHEMESVAQKNREYIIPRWLTVSGSQYAHSPATVAALPEARLLQSMTYTLLEVGEKIANPPIVATEQAVRSDVALFAGGLTWIDNAYDERTGDALRPLTQDSKGMPLTIEMQKDSRSLLAQCFYLNRLTLPQRSPEMTAYEVGQRVQEYIRNALPLFEPMEAEYNGALCEETFNVILNAGGFGAIQDRPRKLQHVDFQFSSPLHEAIEEQKGHKFIEASQLLAQAAAIDKSVYGVVDAKVALRDALAGIGVPTNWTRSKADVDRMEQQEIAKAQAQELLASMQQGATVAKDLASAQSMATPAGA